MRKTISRRFLPGLFLAAISCCHIPAQAWPAGEVGTLFNGPLPANAREFCSEGKTCPVTGVKEVWYGFRTSWMFKLMSGNVACNYDNFSDPAYGFGKRCYERDVGSSSVMPPRLTDLPAVFELNDLTTVEGGRFKFAVMQGSTFTPFNGAHYEKPLVPLALPTDPSVPQNYFEFHIVDEGTPIRQYSVIVSPTMDRCTIHHAITALNSEVSVGRIMEIFAMTTQPVEGFVPQRSDTAKICTNDKGQLTFHLKPPSVDAFQIKVVNYGPAGKPNDVLDFFVARSINWMKP